MNYCLVEQKRQIDIIFNSETEKNDEMKDAEIKLSSYSGEYKL